MNIFKKKIRKEAEPFVEPKSWADCFIPKEMEHNQNYINDEGNRILQRLLNYDKYTCPRLIFTYKEPKLTTGYFTEEELEKYFSKYYLESKSSGHLNYQSILIGTLISKLIDIDGCAINEAFFTSLNRTTKFHREGNRIKYELNLWKEKI